VAFEFRSRSARGLWDVGFFIGSAVVAFVCSTQASLVNGAAIAVDGGQSRSNI